MGSTGPFLLVCRKPPARQAYVNQPGKPITPLPSAHAIVDARPERGPSSKTPQPHFRRSLLTSH
jgi:hypothetical protein